MPDEPYTLSQAPAEILPLPKSRRRWPVIVTAMALIAVAAVLIGVFWRYVPPVRYWNGIRGEVDGFGYLLALENDAFNPDGDMVRVYARLTNQTGKTVYLRYYKEDIPFGIGLDVGSFSVPPPWYFNYPQKLYVLRLDPGDSVDTVQDVEVSILPALQVGKTEIRPPIRLGFTTSNSEGYEVRDTYHTAEERVTLRLDKNKQTALTTTTTAEEND